MKKNTLIIIVVLVAALFEIVSSLTESKSTGPSSSFSSSSNQKAKIEQPTIKLSPYGAKATEDTWPNITDSQAMAGDLLTSNYYIVLDGSGSMADRGCSGNGNKMTAAKAALNTFSGQIPADANVGLFVFDARGAGEKVPLSPFNRTLFMEKVSSSMTGGGTPLKTSVEAGYKALSKQAEAQLGYGEYHLVIVTDGAASQGQSPVDAVYTVINTSPIVIHTIGFCIDSSHSLNRAGLTNYRSADDSKSLEQGLEAVLAEAPSFQTNSFGKD